jgi:cytochrome oxidase assembly protein ShyY1
MLRHVARPRTSKVVLTIAAFVVAAVCIRLGFWQLDRLHGRKEANRGIAAAEARSPEPLRVLLASSPDPTALRFRRATIIGRYDPDREVLLYGRNASTGEAGDHVLTPLILPDRSAIVVDRGWVPIESVVPLTGTAAAPPGQVRIVGVLFPPDALSTPATGASPAVNVTKVDLGQLGGQVPYRLLPFYVLLQRQDPPQAGRLPEMPPLPPFTNGPHFSYAVQWFSFAAIAIVGYGVVLRRERTNARRAEAPTQGGD